MAQSDSYYQKMSSQQLDDYAAAGADAAVQQANAAKTDAVHQLWNAAVSAYNEATVHPTWQNVKAGDQKADVARAAGIPAMAAMMAQPSSAGPLEDLGVINQDWSWKQKLALGVVVAGGAYGAWYALKRWVKPFIVHRVFRR